MTSKKQTKEAAAEQTAAAASSPQQPPSPEKEMEKSLMEEGEDLGFDPRIMAPASVPAVPAQSAVPSVNDPNFADVLASKLGEKIAQFMPNPQANILIMGEMIKQVVLALREPTEEQKALDRQKKANRAVAIKEQQESLEMQRQFQEDCPHETSTSDGKSHSNISAVHNFADGIVRGYCSLCWKIFTPGDPSYKIVIAQHNQAVRSMHS